MAKKLCYDVCDPLHSAFSRSRSVDPTKLGLSRVIVGTDKHASGWPWYFAHVNSLSAVRLDAVRRRLENARRYMDANLESPHTLDELSRLAFLSKFHFLRLFKEAYYETPHQYLRRRRLEAAQRLLTRTNLPVTEVCFRVGFESLGSFSTLFRRVVGAAPNAFRRRYIIVPRAVVPPERLIPCCWLKHYGFSIETLGQHVQSPQS